jgi:hypothetical protein
MRRNGWISDFRWVNGSRPLRLVDGSAAATEIALGNGQLRCYDFVTNQCAEFASAFRCFFLSPVANDQKIVRNTSVPLRFGK